ncbi:protein CCC1-like [Benincasa hispida]|uniref:protein CCC1-like n=1 Tax=Benincasa hispida TaxID=102211 RepID=UPI0019026A0E|nr:protein CCC1-like [Benincasa hispida]
MATSSTEVVIGGREKEEKGKKKRPNETRWSGEVAKSVVYGGLDAIVTCFSLIASISATRHTAVDVLVLGFANLIADGISMGFGDYVATTTERTISAEERAATEWDVDNLPQHHRDLLLQHYQSLGMDFHDASTVVNIMSKYKRIMVEEKKGMAGPPNESEHRPWKNGVATFGSFLLFGCIPLLSFIILIPFTDNESVKFGGACILALLALVLLGIARAKIAATNYGFSIALTVLNGAIAAAAAYTLGWALRNVGGVEDDDTHIELYKISGV